MNTQTLAYKLAGKTAVLAHSKISPDAAEWDNFIEAIRGDVLGKKVKALLVYSAGGAPQHHQRNHLTGLTAFQEIPTEVLLDGGIHWDQAGNRVSAYNWAYSMETNAHLPEEVGHVVDLLDCDDREAVKETLSELQERLAASSSQTDIKTGEVS